MGEIGIRRAMKTVAHGCAVTARRETGDATAISLARLGVEVVGVDDADVVEQRRRRRRRRSRREQYLGLPHQSTAVFHGLRAFVPDIDSAIADLLAFFRSVRRREEHAGLPCFLFGESMGGAICLLIHLRTSPEEWAGAVLVAPMCKISDRIRPPWPLPQILTFVARFAPTLAIVPTADLIEKSVKVPAKRLIAARNPMRYNGRPRLDTVVELLRATDELGARLGEVTVPFLVVHGSADEVTDPAISRALYDAAASEDKTIKIYDGMLHSMLFGEPDENIERVCAAPLPAARAPPHPRRPRAAPPPPPVASLSSLGERDEMGEKRGKERRLTWPTDMWGPRGSHADSAVTSDKTGLKTTERPQANGFVS
uniref:Serine aminopeptidase S33 domain-containing protein n=1 Tax=Oryza minuta TaxID=63629 RepID=G9C330_ORYMI|nr:hypothetical protein [Oryza minuta]